MIMKKILLLTFVFICSLIISAQDLSKIDITLQQEMALSAKTDMLRISIILSPQYDQIELRNKAVTIKNKEAKRNFVVNELKQFSEETQKNLLTVISKLEVSSIQSFWISNSISCYASIDAIEILSYHPDILLIGLETRQYLLPEGETPTPADPKREITYNITKVQADEVWELGYRRRSCCRRS